MEDRTLSTFISTHSSHGALASIGVSGASCGGGDMSLLLPSSPLHKSGNNNSNNVGCVMNNPNTFLPSSSSSSAAHHNTALNLSTYTAGEDAGRLAMMAKEFGLARMRPPKRQLRKHAFQAFLRNHPDNVNEVNPLQSTHAKVQSRDDRPPQSLEATTEDPSTTSNSITPSSSQRHPPLRFIFSGYSLWLELAQVDIDDDGRGDLDRAMIDAADRHNLGGAIPSPHVTALYGIDTLGEEEMRRRFREDVQRVLLDKAELRRRIRKGGEDVDEDDHVGKLWPDLDATGIIVDVEFDGVKGGTMDMAWAEVSLATSPEHETLLDALYDIFYGRSAASSAIEPASSFNDEKKEECAPRRVGPWVPHLSLCYDNPEGLGPNMTRSSVEKLMREKCPTLKSVLEDDTSDGGVKFTRSVSGISLWRTAGTMAEWKCLDRFEFPLG
mmetsp:Transcript_31655/g.68348  ORF Transcript_31655/g.68348 Transcript_31655/m.68348 type:complete len:439 (+) Transcript_31655:202-1518(+)